MSGREGIESGNNVCLSHQTFLRKDETVSSPLNSSHPLLLVFKTSFYGRAGFINYSAHVNLLLSSRAEMAPFM